MTSQDRRECKNCGAEFLRHSSTQVVCSVGCAVQYNHTRKMQKAAKIQRKETLERRRKLKTRGEWLRDAQAAFNTFIRQRDSGQSCISCGLEPKKKNAGHYLSVGAHPELRFSELNVHLQCESCNTFKSGNQAEYRLRLVEKIGTRAMDWLESAHMPQKLSIEDIIQIRDYYKQKTKMGI